MTRSRLGVLAIATFCIGSNGAPADNLVTSNTNVYGNPGSLIDMPTAEVAPDGEIQATVSQFPGFTKTTLSFQATPRLQASFRYSGTRNLSTSFTTFYDRSFDLKFRLVDEGDIRPAIAVGLRDFVGTGVLSGEYIVATKSIGDRLRVTGGLGWGRLGSYGSDASFGSRPPFSFARVGNGGNFNADEWFRGDMAVFGGASFQVNDRLGLSAEYSSDNYDLETRLGLIDRDIPWNFAVDYKVNRDLRLRAFLLHGNELGFQLSFAMNPRRPPVKGGNDLAPLPVAVRAQGTTQDLGWTTNPGQKEAITASLDRSLDQSEIDLEGVRLEGRSAHVVIRNDRYDAVSQALGRTLRTMSRELPPSVETLHVTLLTNGVPASTMTFSRTDLERLENRPASEALAAATFTDTLRFGEYPDPLPGTYPRFTWSIGPFLRTSFFDPDSPVRYDVGLRARGQYELGQGWVLTGSVGQRLFGNLDNVSRPNNSVIPRVRSDTAEYNRTDEPFLENLTVAKYGRLGPDLYSRVTGGYLERQYAGASGEVLWKRVDSRFALGAELNFVHPRDFNQHFGLRSRGTAGGTIPQWNGHMSAYYDLGNGFHAQVDAGRYLAGDWGATLSLDREFANGWRVGAFVTRTDVSAADFGEGSFDRGIRFTIPLSWIIGKPTTQKTNTVIRPLTRDGGQRLNVDGRLYEVVRGAHEPEIAKSWGKYWR